MSKAKTPSRVGMEAAEALLDQWEIGRHRGHTDFDEASKADIASIIDQTVGVEEIRAALAPFADMARHFEHEPRVKVGGYGTHDDDEWHTVHRKGEPTTIYVRDLRRAATLLSRLRD